MLMKKFTMLFLSLILFLPFIPVNAVIEDTELVIENIQIEPVYPDMGQLATITADVYNAGILETNSLSSIVTVAYFVDEDLLYIDEIGNVKPGLSNKIKISSIPIWNVEPGNHTVKIILDYHDTLNDQNDSPDNNTIEKIFFIDSRDFAKLSLNVSPQYIIPNENILLEITTSIEDVNSGIPLDNKEIIITFDDDVISLITNPSGTVSFSKMINSSDSLTVEANFEGDSQNLSSNSSLIVHSIPNSISSGMLMKITDVNKQYNFEDYSFEFAIFQNTYDNLFTTISPVAELLDPTAFLIPLPPGHDYFTEVYLDGRFLFLTNDVFLQEDSIFAEDLIMPDPAEIRFKVVNELGEPQQNATVNNWIYSATTDEMGFTEWIEVLPTVDNRPYDAEIILPDQKTVSSNSFFVFSGERKTVHMVINESQNILEIPGWIRNNAGWWATQQIDDQSFIDGIQYLIKEGIVSIPATSQSSSSGSNEIPGWIRNNAGWWATQQIDDQSFIDGIQYLIKESILKIN